MSQLPALMKMSPVDKMISVFLKLSNKLGIENAKGQNGTPPINPVIFEHIKALTQALMSTHNSAFVTAMKENQTEDVVLNVFLMSLYNYLRNFGVFHKVEIDADNIFKPLNLELKIDSNFISITFFKLDSKQVNVIQLLDIIAKEINKTSEPQEYEAGAILTARDANKVVFGKALMDQH